MTKLEILQERASRGNDAKAINLLAELDRYFLALESETLGKIKQHYEDITYVLAQPDALAIDITVPTQLVKIATDWGKAIDPSFGDDSQIVNG